MKNGHTKASIRRGLLVRRRRSAWQRIVELLCGGLERISHEKSNELHRILEESIR